LPLLWSASMDRALILTYLQAAEDYVSSGERQITNLRDFILSLKCARSDTASEVARMHEMEKAQIGHKAKRDRLRAELAVLDAEEDAEQEAVLIVATV
jgi:hypothetical protein